MIGGTTFDVDGRLVVHGEAGGPAGTAVVRLAAGGTDASLVPSSPNASFGADVRDRRPRRWRGDCCGVRPQRRSGVPLRPRRQRGCRHGVVDACGFVSGVSNFGRSIALSADRLVVGDPFDGTPIAGAGAARVYERTGPGAMFAASPVKLQASDADVSDTFGDDVAIDGDVIVVGAPIAQKFAFPLRDGAAYVYQFNGASWVETDKLRAADGFQEVNSSAMPSPCRATGFSSAPRTTPNDNGPDAGAFYFFETTAPPVGVHREHDRRFGPRIAPRCADRSEHRVDRGRPRPDHHQLRHPGARAAHDLARHGTAEHHATGGDRRVHAARKRANTAAIDQAIDAVIQIELSGALTTGTGLDLAAGSTGSTVRGLAINRFSGRAIGVFGGGGHTISGNYLGVRPDGSVVTPAQGEGMQVDHRGTPIGGTGPADRNLISGNASYGVFLGSECDSQRHPRQLHRDRPDRDGGTCPTGAPACRSAATATWSGESRSATESDLGQRRRSVFASRVLDGNSIQGNYIGTDAAARSLSPTDAGGRRGGVLVQSGAVGTLIGGTPSAPAT